MEGDRGVVAGAGGGLRPHLGSPRRPPRLRGDDRPDQRPRRDGRRRDHLAARARRAGPQLRLPLRLDARPVLRGPRGGAGGRPAAARPGARASSPNGCSPTGPRSAPACTVTGELVPEERRLGLPGYPGGGDVARQPGPATSSSSTSSARRCCSSPPPPSTTGSTAPLAGGRGRRGGDRRATGRRRRRGSGSWSRAAGPTATWSAPPGCARSPPGRRRGRCAARWLALADDLVAEASRWGTAPDGALAACRG